MIGRGIPALVNPIRRGLADEMDPISGLADGLASGGRASKEVIARCLLSTDI